MQKFIDYGHKIYSNSLTWIVYAATMRTLLACCCGKFYYHLLNRQFFNAI